MSEMEQIETTIGDDEFLAALSQRLPPLRQLVPGNNLVAKIHGEILADAVLAWQRF